MAHQKSLHRTGFNDANTLTSYDFLLYALVVLFWGTSWIAVHWQLGAIAPEVSLFWRFSLAAAIMACWVLATGGRLRFSRSHHLRFALMGLTIFSTNFLLFYYGGLSIPSGLLAVVFSLASGINLLLTFLIFGNKPAPRTAIAAIIGFIGVGLMFAPRIMGIGFSASALTGLALCLGGTLSFCLGNMVSLLNHRHAVPNTSATAWGMSYGALFLMLFSLARGQSFTVEPTLLYIGSLLWSSVCSSVLAFAAYLALLTRIGPGRGGYATVLLPVVALAVSTLYEDYTWSWQAVTGLLIVLCGNLLMLAPKR